MINAKLIKLNNEKVEKFSLQNETDTNSAVEIYIIRYI